LGIKLLFEVKNSVKRDPYILGRKSFRAKVLSIVFDYKGRYISYKTSRGLQMSILSTAFKMAVPLPLSFLVSCQMADLAQNPIETFRSATANEGSSTINASEDAKNVKLNNVLSLKDVIQQATPDVKFDAGFATAVASAVKADPKVQLAKAEVLQRQAKLGVSKSQLDFQFAGTVYAGIEDVTDDINGVAAVLSASKMMYDGGQVSNNILADQFAVQAALEGYRAKLDERALEVGRAWVELERYQSLNIMISSRLMVLEPLITQLERVADAGVGDATQVAAAQRTVAMIRVTETDVQQRLAQAELNFIQILGKLPENVKFDDAIVAKAVPTEVTLDMAVTAPALLSGYASYMSALQSLEAIRAQGSVTVGIEAKIQRPFASSGYDSDESIGFVVRKTIYDGGKLASDIQAAQAVVNNREATLKDIYRSGREAVEAAVQSISSMDKAIALARLNAQALHDEIKLLRKQLVIGQSTLESVLSAEARLYEAESKEIHFTAEKHTSQLGALSALGRLSELVGVRAQAEL
jgi:outer membrane protein TolC